MAAGGGFCDRHGPFDPPNQTCPYCAQEDAQRRAYGPPAGGAHSRPQPPEALEGEPTNVVHRPAPPPDEGPAFTEVIPREDAGAPEAAPEVLEVPDLLPAPPVAPAPLGWLIVKAPLARRGEIIPVRANQIIGREGDVRWDDPRLSRQHARVTLEPPPDSPQSGSAFHLWPFGTTNPVFINGQEIRGATLLHENDEIQLGDTLFVFKLLRD